MLLCFQWCYEVLILHNFVYGVMIMSNETNRDEYGFQTRAVHTGNDVDSETGAIKRPITMANSYALPYAMPTT